VVGREQYVFSPQILEFGSRKGGGMLSIARPAWIGGS